MSKTPSPRLTTLYTTSWCGGCWQVKQWLADHGLTLGQDFEEILIDEDDVAAAKLETLNNGYRSVPTLVFEDGSQLTEPSVTELVEKFGPKIPGA